ncbi:hypothetical protein VSS74_05775 [Conexibacter stalactiti]|uniref:Lipoprotein LprG n=1 Tax=Conexibacter stalactiti TaxID=1940611 RepID=A0ABU4HKN2_9ACTN|nr:hypothetical protein [Conexibacter stalactiti]MDW5593832.1 hypothetical protein [Conexibacter stalactiti]MEC5034474.1 hypothetical protein [Conexibacter stalactiti]
MSARATAVALLVAVAFATGCGGSDDAPSAVAAATTAAADRGRPVTDEQALVLARLLQQNWQRGGARFTGELPIHGTTVAMRGRVDFRSGRGTAVLRDPSGQARRYAWTRRAVLAQAQPGSTRYVAKAPDPDGDPVHAGISFLNLLSAETIDNTTNIKDQNASFAGSGTLDGIPVDVYDYGATRYWVQRNDGLLRRVEGEFGADALMSVTLVSHRPVRIALPRASRHER